MSRHNPRIEALRQKYPADQWGVWEIRGEDPNCDLGGHHSNPRLAVVQGRYDEVLRRAVEMPGFWTWGYGGVVEPLPLVEIEELDRVAELEAERKALKDRLEQVEQRLRAAGRLY